MMEVAFGIACVAAGAAGGLAGWLWVERRRLARARDELGSQVESQRQALSDRDRELALANQKLAALDEKQADLQKLLEEAKGQFKDTFDALAGKALKGSTDEFLKLAREVFEAEQQRQGKHLEANRLAVENLVKPVKESLTRYQQTLAEAEKQRQEAFGSLRQQAEALSAGQQELNAQTGKLVQALRRPEVRGRWGEMQMERLFELAGMTEHVDYDEQATADTGEGPSVRPDFVIRLPNERVIVIDVKTPVDAYLDAMEATEAGPRAEHLERHARQLKQAASNLASKGYWERISGSPEFVVMFIPGEAMLYAAAQHDARLMDWAMERNVILATPTLLLALLKTVHMGWRERSLADNAERIAEAGRDLHERLAVVAEHMDKLGRQVDRTVDHYNKLVGSVEGRLMPAARRFSELEADSNKSLPERLTPVDAAVRPVSEASLPVGRGGDEGEA